MKRRAIVLVVLALGAATVAGCGAEEATEGAAPEPRTVTEVVTQAPVTVTEAAPTPPPVPEPASDPDPAPPAGSITVPDVVGLDHQLAQDTMQAAGLYALAEEDASGQGRLLLWDRNWVVVSQDPPAGTRVSEDAVITLRSKKDDE
jgi:hypothetical protein